MDPLTARSLGMRTNQAPAVDISILIKNVKWFAALSDETAAGIPADDLRRLSDALADAADTARYFLGEPD